MRTKIENEFAKRVVLFFKFRGLLVEPKKDKSFIDFLFEQFQQEGRLKEESLSFRVTNNFILRTTTLFLDIHPLFTLALLSKPRLKRAGVSYQSNTYLTDVSASSTASLIKRLGRRKHPEYKITDNNGGLLSPQTLLKVKHATQGHNVSITPLRLVEKDTARRQGLSKQGREFRQHMTKGNLSLWVAKTPPRNKGDTRPEGESPDRVRFRPLSKELGQLPISVLALAERDTEQFKFSVTLEDIKSSADTARGVSQKRVMGNLSALEYLRSLGAIIGEKSGYDFHLAHRRAKMFCGEQSRDNLDPMTAAANYDTLFKVEYPILKLLLKQHVEIIEVSGKVIYSPETSLPFKVQYDLSWGSGDTMTVFIDPMSHRMPTQDERKMAEILALEIASSSSPSNKVLPG